MLAIITICCIALVAIGLVLVVILRQFVDATIDLTHEVQALRLTSRTRIKDYSVQSAPPSHEQVLERVGRASRGKRIVVGGEEDAQLNQDLKRQNPTNPAMVDNE